MCLVQERSNEMQELTALRRRLSSRIADGQTVRDTVPSAVAMPIEVFRKGESTTPGDRQMSAHNVIRILSVDSHQLLREGVATIINRQPDMRLVSQASSGPEAIQQYRRHKPDVTLMDLRLPGVSGIDTLIAIRAEFPSACVVILTTFDGDVEVQRALEAGACGYFLKTTPPDELVKAIRQVHAGNKRVQGDLLERLAEHMGEEQLTTREVQVLEQVVAGQGNREVGKRLFISEETVKVHMKHIMGKLGAKDRTHAVVLAERRGIIRLGSDSWPETPAMTLAVVA
jgi:DNA-binding NarL/FixJ family response regulator